MAAERAAAGPRSRAGRDRGERRPGWISSGLAAVLSAEPRTPLSRKAIAADYVLGAIATTAALAAVIIAHGALHSVASDHAGWMPVLEDGKLFVLRNPALVPHMTSSEPGLGGLTLAGVALTGAPLAFRRRWPVAAFWLILAAILSTGNNSTIVTFVAVIFAAYCAVTYGRYRVLAMASLLAGGLVAAAAFPNTTPPLPGRYTALLMLTLTAVLASVLRQWRDRAGDSAERLRRAEAEHEAATRRALELERARIASELHDVVTHNVSVMVVQAGAARQVLDASPDDAREALLAVEASGRAAMAELRHLLGLLCPSGEAGTSDIMLRPQPGLGELSTLIGRVRAAGLPVELSVDGTPQALPPGLDLAAYRVVQEALTNVIRHAGQSRTAVRLGYRPGELTIDVTDDGPAGGQAPAPSPPPRAAPVTASSPGAAPPGAAPPRAAPPRAGRGLIGLRERIALYGGELDAGPRPGGGWRVRARIPVGAPVPPPGAGTASPVVAGPPLPAELRVAGP